LERVDLLRASMSRRQTGVLGAAARLLVATALAGCSSLQPSPPPEPASPGSILAPSSPSPTPDLGPGPSISIEDAEVSFVASLDAPAVTPGGRIVATIVVTNRGWKPLHYPGGRDAYRYGGDFWFDFSTPALDTGQAWVGDRKRLKAMLFDPYPGPLVLGRKGGIGCDATGFPAVLLPGATVQVAQTWDSRYGDGYPASPGRYQLNVRFALFRPPDDTLAPLTTILPIIVLPALPPTPPGRAVDLALAHPAVGQWLALHRAWTWPTRPTFVYRPETADFELILVGAKGARLVATVANDGRGPVAVDTSPDPNYEAEPSSPP
jgi:hypothetical protein